MLEKIASQSSGEVDSLVKFLVDVTVIFSLHLDLL